MINCNMGEIWKMLIKNFYNCRTRTSWSTSSPWVWSWSTLEAEPLSRMSPTRTLTVSEAFYLFFLVTFGQCFSVTFKCKYHWDIQHFLYQTPKCTKIHKTKKMWLKCDYFQARGCTRLLNGSVRGATTEKEPLCGRWASCSLIWWVFHFYGFLS